MKAWWESYGLIVTVSIAFAIGVFQALVETFPLDTTGFVGCTYTMWATFLQKVQTLMLGAMLQLGIRVAASPTNSTSKEMP